MARIASDPALDIVPDFASANFQGIRLRIIGNTPKVDDFVALKTVASFRPSRKVRSTWTPFQNGKPRPAMSSSTSRSCMASCYTLPSLSPQDELTSPSWKPCSPFSATVLSCLVPHLETALQTSGSGLQRFVSPAQFLASRFTEITEKLWEAGGKDEAATVPQIRSSSAFTVPLNPLPASSSHAMSLALSILQTTRREEGTPTFPSSAPHSYRSR
jgi:hypothetical protein